MLLTVKEFAAQMGCTSTNVYSMIKTAKLMDRDMFVRGERGKTRYLTDEGQEILRNNMRTVPIGGILDTSKQEILQLTQELEQERRIKETLNSDLMDERRKNTSLYDRNESLTEEIEKLKDRLEHVSPTKFERLYEIIGLQTKVSNLEQDIIKLKDELQHQKDETDLRDQAIEYLINRTFWQRVFNLKTEFSLEKNGEKLLEIEKIKLRKAQVKVK